MNRQDFLTARDFIYSDIQREINLAQISEVLCEKEMLYLYVKR